jgi:hypothetical protein
MAGQGVYGLLKPAEFGAAMRRFPRSLPWGYALMALATAWFVWNLKQENIADFAPLKPPMMIGFAALGVSACVFLRDFLAVRGLAIVMLLLAQFVLDVQRWHESGWKNVIALLAYLWVVAGMWFTISPWRMRDIINWKTATEQRICLGSAVRLALGILLVVLGLIVF